MNHRRAIEGPLKLCGLILALCMGLCTSSALAAAERSERSAAQKRSSTASAATSAKRAQARRQKPAKAVSAVKRASVGELSGLKSTDDPLALKSSVALVLDQD